MGAGTGLFQNIEYTEERTDIEREPVIGDPPVYGNPDRSYATLPQEDAREGRANFALQVELFQYVADQTMQFLDVRAHGESMCLER
jgi:hypothetical protein